MKVTSKTCVIHSLIIASLMIAPTVQAQNKVVVIPLGSSAEGITEEMDPTVIESVKDGVSWEEVTNIPAGFADGTDNTGITMESDPTVPASVKDGVSWGELSSIPAGFADGVDDGITTETDPTVLESVKDGISWGEVTNKPAGFADNIDHDSGGDITAVNAGTGLSGGGSSGTVTLNVDIPFSLATSVSGGLIRSTNSYSTTGYGVYGSASGSSGRGVYGYASGDNGIAVYAYSNAGDGIYALTGGSNEHAGYFDNGQSVGLAGATIYARSYNTTGDGIALWAHNDHATSTDATAVFSNDGSGPLLKGFGGNDGEYEFVIENNGSILIDDPTISDTVISLEADRGLITLGSGSATTTGDDGDLWLTNNSGSNTIELDGQAGVIRLSNEDQNATIIIDPQEGSSTDDGGQITLYNNAGVATIEIDGSFSGDGRITTNELQITGGSDLSEHFDIDKHLNPEPGMLVSIDPMNPGKLQISDEPYDRKVAGIISGAGGIKTGMMMGQQNSIADGAIPVALTGRVYCMAETSHGAIKPGDLLTTSTVPGHAMKVTDHGKAAGAIIGKAMTPLNKSEGLILVLVSLQ